MMEANIPRAATASGKMMASAWKAAPVKTKAE